MELSKRISWVLSKNTSSWKNKTTHWKSNLKICWMQQTQTLQLQFQLQSIMTCHLIPWWHLSLRSMKIKLTQILLNNQRAQLKINCLQFNLSSQRKTMKYQIWCLVYLWIKSLTFKPLTSLQNWFHSETQWWNNTTNLNRTNQLISHKKEKWHQALLLTQCSLLNVIKMKTRTNYSKDSLNLKVCSLNSLQWNQVHLNYSNHKYSTPNNKIIKANNHSTEEVRDSQSEHITPKINYCIN